MDRRAYVVEKTQELINQCMESSNLRTKETAFTRKRKLGPMKILHILLQRLIFCLQLALDKYFNFIEENPVSKQAFSKARAGLNPEYVRKFTEIIAQSYAMDKEIPSYLGMRLIAIDGSYVALPNSDELKQVFGCSGSKKNAATALASMAYGPLDHAVYDCQLSSYTTDERTLAKLHMQRLLELGLKNSLLLCDRWYPSQEFIAYTLNAGFSFVMRVRRKWNLTVDAIKDNGYFVFNYNGEDYRIRVIKVKLSTGEYEILLTNLTEEQLPTEKAGELYFKRWGIETAYDILKSKLQLENLSGKTEISVRQDFYATVYLMGLAEICAAEATCIIQKQDESKSLKYQRKANMNRTIKKLRDDFWEILFEPDPDVRAMLFEKLCLDIAARPESIRPERTTKRKLPRKLRFHITKKSVLP